MAESSPSPFASQHSIDAPEQTPSLLSSQSYTAHRLKHAQPEHLHLTTRRCFIGPIPEGWLKSHRRDWYKRHLHIHYSSRSASFAASANTGSHRRLTGIDDNHSGARAGHSFPQPQSLNDEYGDETEAAASTKGNTAVAEDSPDLRGSELPSEAPTSSPTNRGTGRASSVPPPVSLTPASSEALEQNNTPNQSESRTSSKPQVPSSAPSKQHQEPDREPSKVTSTARLAPSRPKSTRKPSGTSSFVTAHEQPDPPSPKLKGLDDREQGKESEDSHEGNIYQTSANDGSGARTESVAASSTAPLLDSGQEPRLDASPLPRKSILHKSRTDPPQPDGQHPDQSATKQQPQQDDPRTASGLVRFNLPDEAQEDNQDQMVKVRLAQFRRRDTLKRLREGKVKDGAILKMEKMLVRIELTSHDMQEDFDENDSQRIESRTISKWREFMVVCRESADDVDEFVLQMYKTRVIHAIEKTSSKQRSAHQLQLNRKTKINIFSSLDKTIVLWDTYKGANRIFIMKPRSGANSMEWYTFLRNLLGWDRPSMLQVNVPDLNVSLRIDHPFENLESSEALEQAAGGDMKALARTVEEEKAAAGRIVLRCMKMLEDSPEWGAVIEDWATPQDQGVPNEIAHITTAQGGQPSSGPKRAAPPLSAQNAVGLAWKRYDRLEWIKGAEETNLYGCFGMTKTHELELRPKQHYPTKVLNKKGKPLLEPAPVEGFLVRLTSQKGAERRLGKLFYKRLYFSTHNNYLVFNRPAMADPPPPPAFPTQTDSGVPSASRIAQEIPLIYAINPYPIQNGEIEWLSDAEDASAEEISNRDRDAYDENERAVNLVLKCDGVIDLCNVTKIRKMQRGAIPADDHIEEGSEVDFDEEVADSGQADGRTGEVDDVRTFELVLKNGLIVRLQSFDKATKQEWIKRLRALVRYWKLRKAADIALYKAVRKQNLDHLKIDEDMEAVVGQFARKWEVRQSYASPELYNMCGISCCRSLQMSGILYRKPRLHASFDCCRVILCHGHLLVFDAVMRNRSGKLVPHIHHSRTTSLDLNDCYIYSGLITSDDLLYSSSVTTALGQGQPGSHRGLPRMYPEDGWSSTDEDSMTCFVVWHGKRRSWFRTEKAQGRGTGASAKIKMVQALGKEGRSVVFKTRSRAERDHWVMNIALEIERTAKRDDVRVVK